jgi:hypothetical protein
VPGDRPIDADFDGDGRADLAVFRPGNNTWYVFNPFTSYFRTQVWGEAGDIAVPADYDGDGAYDIAIFRPGNQLFYVINSANGAFATRFVNGAGNANVSPLPRSAQPE